MNWLFKWWFRRQRQIDLNLLWPLCRDQAPDMHHARAAFAVHAFNDPAWLFLGEDEIVRSIDALGE